MKKILMLVMSVFVVVTLNAQIVRVPEIKEQLARHPARDTFRVNRLNDLAGTIGLVWDQREQSALEALAIARDIRYLNGEGYASIFLYSIYNNFNLPEAEAYRLRADSIATVINDPEFTATVLWRTAITEPDSLKRKAAFEKAYKLSGSINDRRTQILVLINQGGIFEVGPAGEAFFRKADSIARKLGDVELMWRVKLGHASWVQTEDQFLDVIAYARTLSLPPLLAQSLIAYSEFLSRASKQKESLDVMLEAEKVVLRSGYTAALPRCRNAIGNMYMNVNVDYAKAMGYFVTGLREAEEEHDSIYIVTQLTNLGTLYSYMGDQTNSLDYFLRAEKIVEGLPRSVYQRGKTGDLQLSIGERYRLMDKYPEAIAAYNRAIEKYQSSPWDVGLIETNLADVYTRMGNLDLAFKYAFSGREKTRQSRTDLLDSWLFGVLSRAYLKSNQADSALYYAQLGLKLSDSYDLLEMQRDNALALSNAYAFKKDFKNAYTNYQLYVRYRDSIVNQEVRNRVAVQQYNYDLGKKESQITALHAQKQAQRSLLIGAVVLIALIMAIATLLLRNNRQKQKANRLLKKQKADIDDKARELERQKGDVELLSDIGRKVTASLSVEKIIGTAYNNVNRLMDANVFGIGIYNDDTRMLEFPCTYENGEPLPFYSHSIDDESRFGAICFSQNKEIIMGDLDSEYQHFLQQIASPHEGDQPVSVIFIPLVSKDERLGVITVQSFQKNAYSDYQLFMLRNIATYASIAIQNAESYENLNHTLERLKATQAQLIHSEKMASLGELTAGIAHEIQNPLNFVNNFSEINGELIDELGGFLSQTSGNGEQQELLQNLRENSIKILHHGKRADSIVKGMLQHSRSSTGIKQPTDINALVDEYVRLSYHGLRAKDKTFNADFKTDLGESVGMVNVVPQDVGRVLLNMFNNAFQEMMEKKKNGAEDYMPRLTVSTRRGLHSVEIRVKDNGNGIPKSAVTKIFQPFFTTKPAGGGTGLGLSLSYDIVKAHNGDISVQTSEGEGTEFIIQLPCDSDGQ